MSASAARSRVCERISTMLTTVQEALSAVDQVAVDEVVPPMERSYLQVENRCAQNDESPLGRYRIMQWNILAQTLSGGKNNFVRCSPETLSLNRRRQYIVWELLRWQPDIVCLQEVDIFSSLDQVMQSAGYSGVFRPKNRSPCLLYPGNTGPDGCAVFYNSERLQMVSEHPLTLCGDHGSHVALIVKLKDIHSDHQFTVTVTHLKAKQGFSEVRYQQGESLLEQLSEISGDSPVVLCGDLNASPEEEVVSHLMKSKFQSAYAAETESGTEPLFTTWKIRGSDDFGNKVETSVKRTEDYVLYTPHWSVSGLFKLPEEHLIGADALPNQSFPSDHLSLCVDFVLNDSEVTHL